MNCNILYFGCRITNIVAVYMFMFSCLFVPFAFAHVSYNKLTCYMLHVTCYVLHNLSVASQNTYMEECCFISLGDYSHLQNGEGRLMNVKPI